MDFIFDILWAIFLIVASYIDLKTYRISNLITLGGFIVLITLKGFYIKTFPGSFLISSLAAFSVMLIFFFISKGKLGMGDVKLSLITGGVLGLYYWFISLFLASLTALLILGTLIFLKKWAKEKPFPFGPFLSFGALAAWGLQKGAILVP
ncbi:MAG: A24 family peptidase [Spirochaetales bacterium]|nr:A24 family peptidase [Spirochaetales bacterium]